MTGPSQHLPPPMIPLPGYRRYPPKEMLARAREFADDMHRRRTVRDFSDRPVPRALIEQCQRAGLATLTNTPSPMGFLNEILGRPKDLERPFLLLVVGYPAADARVPDIGRKELAETVVFVESEGSDPGTGGRIVPSLTARRGQTPKRGQTPIEEAGSDPSRV